MSFPNDIECPYAGCDGRSIFEKHGHVYDGPLEAVYRCPICEKRITLLRNGEIIRSMRGGPKLKPHYQAIEAKMERREDPFPGRA